MLEYIFFIKFIIFIIHKIKANNSVTMDFLNLKHYKNHLETPAPFMIFIWQDIESTFYLLIRTSDFLFKFFESHCLPFIIFAKNLLIGLVIGMVTLKMHYLSTINNLRCF